MPAISTMSRLGGGDTHNRTKSRWMVLSQEPVAGYYRLIYLDGISGETLSNGANVPTHPLERSSAVSDHAVKGSKAYSVQGYLGTPLVGDNIPPKRNAQEFVAAYSDVPVMIYPPAAATQGPFGAAIFNDRGASILVALEMLLGVPVDLFSPRYGKIKNFVLTSYNDQRDGSTRIGIDLSFQKIRRATVDRVIIPKIPRARNQEPVANKGEIAQLKDDVSNFLGGDKSVAADVIDYINGDTTSSDPQGPSPSADSFSQLLQESTSSNALFKLVTGAAN